MEGRSKARRGYFQSPTAVTLASGAPATTTSSIQAVKEPDPIVGRLRKQRSAAVRTKSPPVTSTSFRSQRVTSKDPFQVGSRVIINSKLSCPRKGSVHAVCFGSLKVKLDFGTSITVNRDCCTLEATGKKERPKPATKRSTSAERIPRSRLTSSHHIPQEVPKKKLHRSSETMRMTRPEPSKIRSRSNDRERESIPKRTSSAEATGRRLPAEIRKSPADNGRRSLFSTSHAKVGRATSPPRLSTIPKAKAASPKSASTEFSHFKPKMRERSPALNERPILPPTTNGERPSSPVKKRPQSPIRKHTLQHKSSLDFSMSTQLKREGRSTTKGKTSLHRSHTHSHPQPMSYDTFYRGDSIPRQKLNCGEGGFCRLAPNDFLSNRYELVSLLGRGQSSTVWFAKDTKAEPQSDHQYVAIKVTKCAKNIRCSSLHEIALLYFIKQNSSNGVGIAQLLNHFEHDGMHGVHVCMVFELLGHPLDVLMAQSGFRGIKDISLVKDITKSILKALKQLKLINVVHTDMKPENLMFVKPSADVLSQVDKRYRPEVGTQVSLLEDLRAQRKVKISDFGLSFLLRPSDGKRHTGEDLTESDQRLIKASNYVKGALIQTREYRAPEIILGNDFTCETDIWSLACIVYEMVTGRFLFDPKSKPGVIDEHTNDVQHLSEITQTIGPPDAGVIQQDNGVYVSKFYTKSGLTRGTLNHKISDMRSRVHEAVPDDHEAILIINFIMSCLTWCPSTRPDASACLNHEWLTGCAG
eukprot:TRINITY_DN10310_c1_g1_i1.p1 TRINITY_DN10310_c1_g1~~TRINITY_DN10310_c1_g1_i1.p1  ORF type:complete len:754 (+),score=70.79 TRINITY_DN10310_c1_g1_i1:58-2319(+)